MKLNRGQSKIVHSKPCGYSIIRGLEGCGKTTTAVYRGLYLKNHYCLYKEDKILMLTHSNQQIKYINEVYGKAEEETKLEYLSLFSNQNNKFDLFNIDNILYEYFNEYNKNHNYEIILDAEKKNNILSHCILDVKKLYPRLKTFKTGSTKFFMDEIKWIKSNNYTTIQAYQNAQRTGAKVNKVEGPKRLLKNSTAREAIFKLMLLYNNKLKEENLIDYEDMNLIALKQAQKMPMDKYSQIIIDESEKFTKVQIDFIKELYNEKPYSNIVFIVDTDKNENRNSYLVKRGRLNAKNLAEKVKKHTLKVNYKNNDKRDKSYRIDSKLDMISSMETFQYCDLRHNKKFEFLRDFSNREEVIVNDEEYKHDELRELPVFNEIAAGMPLLINPEQEGNFYIPKYWLKGIKDAFILKVKGDSMIGADINDGDLVVIRKQYNAQNGNIVAVDLHGSATLKRLFIGKDEILLMPENDQYKPIPIDEEGIYIIGIVVGVLKKKIRQM